MRSDVNKRRVAVPVRCGSDERSATPRHQGAPVPQGDSRRAIRAQFDRVKTWREPCLRDGPVIFCPYAKKMHARRCRGCGCGAGAAAWRGSELVVRVSERVCQSVRGGSPVRGDSDRSGGVRESKVLPTTRRRRNRARHGTRPFDGLLSIGTGSTPLCEGETQNSDTSTTRVVIICSLTALSRLPCRTSYLFSPAGGPTRVPIDPHGPVRDAVRTDPCHQLGQLRHQRWSLRR